MGLLVSIIIPNFNRAHLIIDTLNSIRNQNYPIWECLIIDDLSTDNSKEVISKYILKDERFKFFLRPTNRVKGANSCRNYGFELSKGNFIQWFDSDDIMVYNHISTLVHAIIDRQVDFVVGYSRNFNEEKGLLGQPFNFERETAIISAENYAKQKIGWITDDFIGKREILENLYFNDKLKSLGDEYNFFVKMLHENTNGIFIDICLTYRRLHIGSSSDITYLQEINHFKNIVELKFLTFKDTRIYGDKDLLCWYLSGYMQYAFKISLKGKFPPFFISSLKEISYFFSRSKMLNFITAIFMARFYGRGYRFLRTAIQY